MFFLFKLVFVAFGMLYFSGLYAKAPTSDIPSKLDGGFKFACHLRQVPTFGIKSATYKEKEVKVSEFENTTTIIPHGQSIYVNCDDENYVFGVKTKNFFEETSKRYLMTCDNGGFQRLDKTRYCDKKCDISLLSKLGYTVPMTTLFPGETGEIECPKDQTTRNGAKFPITCEQNGFLNSESPKCFKVNEACPMYSDNDNNKKVPSGTTLSCNGKYGLTILSCNNASWVGRVGVENVVLCNDECFKGCQESIATLTFDYQNINEALVNFIDEVELSVEEYVNLCKQNPELEECKQELPTCKFQNIEYSFGTQIKLKCNLKENSEPTYQCMEGWVNSLDNIFSEKFPIEECGLSSTITKIQAPQNSSRSVEKQPSNGNAIQEYKIQKLKSR